MSPQLMYTLLFFVPFVLLIIFVFLITQKIVKLGLFVLISAIIIFFVFSIKISPLDFIFRYGENTEAKTMNLGKYTLTFTQVPGDKFYSSYLKIYDNDTKQENIITLDPEGGKYWNIKIEKDGDNQCFYNLSQKLFCLNTKTWIMDLGDNKTQDLQNIVK